MGSVTITLVVQQNSSMRCWSWKRGVEGAVVSEDGLVGFGEE